MATDESQPHPYTSLAGTALWTQVDRAIKELLQNRDLIETTADPHIVGYICNALVEAGVGRL